MLYGWAGGLSYIVLASFESSLNTFWRCLYNDGKEMSETSYIREMVLQYILETDVPKNCFRSGDGDVGTVVIKYWICVAS